MDEILINWLEVERKTEGFQRFWERIAKQHAAKMNAALAQGETEYEKGHAAALKWVLNQPDEIMKATQKKEKIE